MQINVDYKEIIKKLPWSGTFLLWSFLFFWKGKDLPGWICLVVAIIALFLVIKFEYYEKIIDRQEKQINTFSKQAMSSQKDAIKTMSDASTMMANNFSSYEKTSNNQTDIN